EPAVAQGIAALAFEIAFGDPGSADQQIAERLAVPGQLLAGAVDDLELDAVERAALLAFDRQPVLEALVPMSGLELRGGAERTHLGHAPGMQHLDPVVGFESAD